MRKLTITKLFFLELFLFTYCYAETGVSSKSLVLATFQPLSGPAREYSLIGKSAGAYFNYVNDQGGIHGRSINLKIVDDQMKPEKTNKKLSEFLVKTDTFAIFSGIGNKTFKAVFSLLREQKIPSFFVGSDQPEWTKPVKDNIFTFLPTPEIEAKVLGKYITKYHSGSEMIIWYAERPIYLRSVKAMTKELFGVSAKLLPGKKGRLSAEWNLISKRKPDLLVALGNFHDLMNFLLACPNLDIPIFTGHALADSRITEWLDRSLYQIVRVLTAYPLISEKLNRGILLHNKILAVYEPSLIPNRWTLYGHAVAELMVEVLRRSGRTITREKALSAAETISKWRGQLMPPVYLDSENHLAMTSFRVSQILPGQVNHFSEWIDGR